MNQANEVYPYDLNGNRQNAGYTTGQYNRITNDGVYSYEYDAEGNRTKRTNLSNGEYEEYTWDHRNRLTQVVKKSVSGAILNTVTEAYDPLDRRIKEESSSWGFTNTTWFAYDGGQIALRFDGNGSLTGRYLHGEAVDQIFAEEVGGLTRWTLTEHLGSVRDVLSDTGLTLGRITYDSFGRATNTTGIVDTLFRYTGRPGMSSTWLYDYRARTHDPRVGQFLSEDPIGFTAGDPNLRRYVGNEPTRYTDPSGLRGEQAIPPRPPHPGEPPEFDDMMNSRRKAYFRRLRAYEEWEAKYGESRCDSAGSSTPVLDATQAALDAVGMVDQGPAGAAADIASAGIDLWRGDLLGAFLGLLAALPVVGTGVGVVRKSRAVARAGQPVGGVLHATDAAAKGKKCVGASKGVLRDRLGPKPPNLKKPQAHHDLPQADRFRPHWDRAGLDIEDPAFGSWVEGGPVGGHQKWSKEFNDEWDAFFLSNPMASREQILDFMNKLRVDPRFQ